MVAVFTRTMSACTRVCVCVCVCVGRASTSGHALLIRQHYIDLLDTLDTKYTPLLDILYCDQVLMNE